METKDLSFVTWQTEQYFVDTEHIESRKDLKAFIKQSTGLFEKELQTKGLPTGSPKLIIVSGAALRVADVVRYVRYHIVNIARG